MLCRGGRSCGDFRGLLLHDRALAGAARAEDKEGDDGEDTDNDKHKEGDEQIDHCWCERAGCGSAGVFSDNESL